MENKPKHFSGIQNLLTMIDLSAVRKDCEIVHLICAAVSRRAAYMCAAGISAIARKISSTVYFLFLNFSTFANKKPLEILKNFF